MRKRPAIFLLLVSLLWQSFAIAQTAIGPAHSGDIAHFVMHLENDPHHHHDDGSFHHDDSDESMKHVYGDGSTSTAGVVPTYSASGAVSPGTAEQFSRPPDGHASPVLEGRRRPPRLTA